MQLHGGAAVVRRGESIERLVAWALLLASGLIATLLLAGGRGVVSSAPTELGPHPSSVSPRVVKRYGAVPLTFVPNVGQFAADTSFVARASGFAVAFDDRGARLELRRGARRANIGLRFLDARAARPAGGHRLPGKANFFVGPRSRWRTDVPLFRSVVYDDVWPGIDVSFHRVGEALEYDFVIAPGASPTTIRLAYENTRALSLDASGNLRLDTSIGPVTDHRPIAYQVLGKKRVPVRTRFRLEPGTTRYGLAVGRYDTTRPLVIDPGIVWAASVGGAASQDVTVDAAGNAYVVGGADTRGGPATVGSFDTSFNGVVDAFVAKLNPAGTTLLYWTFIGGGDIDDAHSIAVDSDGNAYITGRTQSGDFPTTTGAFDRSHGGSNDVFVSKLSADGSALLYSTFLGGSGFDNASSVVVDGGGNAYVGGHAGNGYPTTSGALKMTITGFVDAFLTKLNPSGSALVYSTFLGAGGSVESIRNVAVDAAGNAYAAGETDAPDFPTTPGAFDTTPNGDRDVFVAKLDANGSALVYSTLLGDTGLEIAEGLDVSGGAAYVTGLTHSGGFPVTAGNPPNADGDAFIAKLGPAGDTLEWSYAYGGSGRQLGLDLEVDSLGTAYAAGSNEGTQQVFLTRIGSSGTFQYSTELGGSSVERLGDNGVAALEGGFVLVAGQTFSTNFPYSPGAVAGVPDDAFLVKLDTNTAQPLVITGVTEVADPVARYGRFEASIGLGETFDNPFDPSEVAVDVRFTSPTGRVQVVPAFWYQPFTATTDPFEQYTPAGSPGWRVRFAPDEVGAYTYSVGATAGSRNATPVAGSFQATATASDGFVRIDERNDLFLQFDSGEPYVPIGHNVAFEDANPQLTGTRYYSSVFGSLDTAGENWSRVWMTDFNRSALEWADGHYSGFYDGVGVYSLPSAWRMDRILELAEQHEIRIQLVVNDHGQFSTDVEPRRWAARCDPSDPPPCQPGDLGYYPGNPYSSAHGGPVDAATPQGFFTDPEARRLFKQRLRYLVGRYGAFTSLLTWELFNEVEYIGTAAANPRSDPGVRSDIVSWHAEMSSYLDSIDPYGHLVTTSSWHPTATPELWDLPGIDVVQIHTYVPPPTGRTTELRDLITQLKTTYDKPVIVGEVGIGSGDPENGPTPGPPPDHQGFDPTLFTGSPADREHLVEGTHFHNAMWAAALSGSAAGYWWWGNYIAADAAKNRSGPTFPLNERQVPALVSYLDGEDWAPLQLLPAAIGTSGPIIAVGSRSATQAFVWLRDSQNEYGTGAPPGNLAPIRSVTGASLTIPGLDDGSYQVDVYATWGTGGRTGTIFATASGGTLTVQLPTFTRDLALKVIPAVDSDGDGLFDSWETAGIDGDGDGDIDLALHQAPYSADPQRKDLFVEVDFMAAHAPQPGTLGDVVAAFAAAPVSNPNGSTGIDLHAMLGEQVPTIAPARFLTRGAGAADDFDDIKVGGAALCDGFLGTATERASTNCAAVLGARRLAFHYAVFGHSYAEAPTSSGIAELPGNDFMVTLGGKSPDWIAAAGSLREAESGTFMHELGHNLGLRHGGFEDLNCKPNYQSIMVYTRQVPYIDPDRPLDYSREELPTLFEWFLDEPFGVGGAPGNVVFGFDGAALVADANGAIDWNDDGSLDYPVEADVNWIETRPDGQPLPGCGPSPFQVLTGHDDWSALEYDFRSTGDFGDGVHGSAAPLVAQELTAEVALETAQNVDVDGDGVPNAADQPIVFASKRTGKGDIYTMDPTSSTPTRLTNNEAVDDEPVWSPDRTKIAFSSSRDGNSEIYVMDANGANVTRLTSTPRSDTSPAWSPDGRQIVFASNRTSNNWDIYVMSSSGANVTRLTTHSAPDTAPAWSPDGARIAFSSTRTGGGDIYVMNANGTSQTRLTTASGVDTDPAWSGSKIVFATNRHGAANFEIYSMNATGSGETRLTNQSGQDVSPVWSPDGSRIAFASNRHGTPNLELFTMNANGSNQTRRTTEPGDDSSPDW